MATKESKTAPPGITSRAATEQWFPTGSRYTFSIAKGARQLAAAICLEREDERIEVMLGSSDDFKVGFYAAAVADLDLTLNLDDPFQNLQAQFRPGEANRNIDLENHNVDVWMGENQTVINRTDKYYMVDIELKPKPKEPTKWDRLGDRIEDKLEDFLGPDFGESFHETPRPSAPLDELAAGKPAKKSIRNRVSARKRGPK